MGRGRATPHPYGVPQVPNRNLHKDFGPIRVAEQIPLILRPQSLYGNSHLTGIETTELLQLRRKVLGAIKDRADFSTDYQRAKIEQDEYRERLEAPKLSEINRRKIENHMVVLENRAAFAKAMVEQLDLELEILRQMLKNEGEYGT